MSSFCNFCMTKLNSSINVCPNCGEHNHISSLPHHLKAGTILNGRYYVGNSIGEGGFGITYIGYDLVLDVKVAIKEFFPNGWVNRSENTLSPRVSKNMNNQEAVFFDKGKKRFLDEARILAKFENESGVVRVKDAFEENNTVYIIMEYLDGITLKEYLNQKGTLTPGETLSLLMPIMVSLRSVHNHGLLHRDISPDNIMLVDDRVVLIDFGAARQISANENRSLSIVLKPGYAPQEQYMTKGQQGPWTDIYALSATMYKCITGQVPEEALQRMQLDELKKPSELGFLISIRFENTLMQGLNVNLKERYQNIDEFIASFQGFDVEDKDNVKVRGNTRTRPLFGDENEYNNIHENKNQKDVIEQDGNNKDVAKSKQWKSKIKEQSQENIIAKAKTDEFTGERKQKYNYRFKPISIISWLIWIALSIVTIYSMDVIGLVLSIVMLALCALGEYLIFSEKSVKVGRAIVLVIPVLLGLPISFFEGDPIPALIILIIAGLCSWL